MTDNEIIKILENEADFDCGICCDNGENCLGEECASFISRAALDLINRQKAEIEKLKKPLQKLKEIGYCHNFQLERSDLVSWIYAVCDVIEVANKMTEGKNG